MGNPSYNGPERRRSDRLQHDIGIIIRVESPKGASWEEETFTISVSNHGALVLLEGNVAVGQEVTLVNPENQQEVAGKVVRLGAKHGGLAMVGIEFLAPSPEFWPWPVTREP